MSHDDDWVENVLLCVSEQPRFQGSLLLVPRSERTLGTRLVSQVISVVPFKWLIKSFFCENTSTNTNNRLVSRIFRAVYCSEMTLPFCC